MSDVVGSVISRLVTKALAPRPVIRRQGVLLIIESGWRTSLLTAGGRHRRVTINPKSRIILISDRRFWGFKATKLVPFDQIHEVVYTYGDMMANNWVSHDSEDLFRVGLWLTDGKEMILFRFYGQGEFVNNSIWPDWMMWDDILPGQIVQHDMESDSLALAELLSAMVGVPVGNGPL